eukprot:COSAG06_NODE_2707_length_6406_cov_2.662229_6_plen_91_part_00
MSNRRNQGRFWFRTPAIVVWLLKLHPVLGGAGGAGGLGGEGGWCPPPPLPLPPVAIGGSSPGVISSHPVSCGSTLSLLLLLLLLLLLQLA